MGRFTAKRLVLLFMILAILSVGVPASIAQQKIKINGKITVATVHRGNIGLDDTEDHVISIEELEGVNVSTGVDEFMDGAQVVIMVLSDRIKGSGHDQGYAKFTSNGDTVFSKWEGKVTTSLSTNGRPASTFEGTFSFIKGTGGFENIQGSGTYKGKPISRTISIGEWEGEYFIKK